MNRRDFFKRLIAATAVLPLATRLKPSKPSVAEWPALNYIDLPHKTGNITALVPYRDHLLAFTEYALYRIDAVGAPYRFDGSRFRAWHVDYDAARVTLITKRTFDQ